MLDSSMIDNDLWLFRPVAILSRKLFVDFLILKILNAEVIKNLEHFLKFRLDQRS